MTLETPQDYIDELDTVLEEERTALLSGDLSALEPIIARKEEAIQRLNELDALEQAEFTEVQSKVTRNQALLDSAMQGIRSVAARMAEIRRVRKGLDVYDKAGRKTRYGTNNRLTLEKRA